MRESNNQIENSNLINGYDYEHQAWVKNGYYENCGHPDDMNCGCFGRRHADEAWLAHNTVA